MLYMTIITIILPRLLPQSWMVSDLTAIQEQKLQQRLRSISIRILAHGKTIGSGVLLDATTHTQDKRQQVYTIITNAHVIQAASAPFQLQTHDGQVYAAALVTPSTAQNRDLSILRFQSHQRIYATVKLASISPKIGDRVWLAGFPLDLDLPISSAQAAREPNIISGEITQVLPVAISGGYSIGLDRAIRRGMSGGPLINKSGELVGINGVHANPRWDIPEILEDGSKVSDALQERIHNSNWAIPIEFIRDYARF
jgi:S1-C subfamily serine protease